MSRCLYSIVEQAPATVEVLVVVGEGLLGDKVNRAAQAARGEFMTVVDDDDWLTADYMANVLPACHDVDYVGLKVIELIDGRFTKTTATSAEFNRWGNGNRGPVPKGVTRTELWQRHPMGNHYSADRDWLRDVHPSIGSHTFIDRAMYVYDYHEAASAFGGGDHRDVGQWPVDWSRITRI